MATAITTKTYVNTNRHTPNAAELGGGKNAATVNPQAVRQRATDYQRSGPRQQCAHIYQHVQHITCWRRKSANTIPRRPTSKQSARPRATKRAGSRAYKQS